MYIILGGRGEQGHRKVSYLMLKLCNIGKKLLVKFFEFVDQITLMIDFFFKLDV